MFFSILNLLMLALLTVAAICAWRYWRVDNPKNEKEVLLFALVTTGAISCAYVIILGFSAAVAELASTVRTAYSFIFGRT